MVESKLTVLNVKQGLQPKKKESAPQQKTPLIRCIEILRKPLLPNDIKERHNFAVTRGRGCWQSGK